MPRIAFFAALAMSTSLSAGAFAQAKGMITHFTPSNLTQALKELGVTDASARKQPVNNGQTVDVVSFSNAGLKHIAILSVCSKPGCLGVELLTIWGDDAGKTASRSALNTYNASYGYGKGFIGPSGTLVYSRYTISDGGISSQNLKANIGNFVTGSANFQQYMAKSARGGEASLTPGGDAVMSHAAARAATPEADSVLMEMGTSQGLNLLTIQSAPVPDDAPSKPAQ
jgi:hypothetical protein